MLDRFPTTPRTLVLDGGLATELEARGADLHHPLWSSRTLLEQPELVVAVHQAFLDAGADIVSTATYQATFQGLASLGVSPIRAERLLLESVALVRSAWARVVEAHQGAAAAAEAEGRSLPSLRPAPLVAASIGPYGAYRHDGSEYVGNYGLTDRELREFHRDRLAVLAASDADLLALETIPSRREAEVLADLMEQYGGSGWISCSAGGDSTIADGTPFAECVTSLEKATQVIALGINCTGPETAARLLESAHEIHRKPFVVYPNSGERFDARSGTWSGEAHLDWVTSHAERFAAAGARVIGGCCRTPPATIARLKKQFASVGG